MTMNQVDACSGNEKKKILDFFFISYRVNSVINIEYQVVSNKPSYSPIGPDCNKPSASAWVWRMSPLTRDGTAEPGSQDET